MAIAVAKGAAQRSVPLLSAAPIRYLPAAAHELIAAWPGQIRARRRRQDSADEPRVG